MTKRVVTRVVTYNIEHCNAKCPHFYHNYKDWDNMWCDLLEKKIFEDDGGLAWNDLRKRDIPKECPLPMVINCPLCKGGGTIENGTRNPYTVDQWIECPSCKGTGEIIAQNNGSATEE